MHKIILALIDRQYTTIEEEETFFINHLNNLSAHTRLKKGGVLADDFWLRLQFQVTFCDPVSVHPL